MMSISIHLNAADFFTDQQYHQVANYNIQNMKSNKGVLTILANLAEFILQSRIAPSQALKHHFDSLQTQLKLLRSQLLPSTELIHFLVQRHSYNLKNKITTFLKTAPLEQLMLTITFTITNKANSQKQVAEMWKMTIVQVKERDVSRESRAHELLFLIGRLFEQLHSKELLNELARNRQSSQKYLIDFQIDIKQEKLQKLSLNQFGKVTFNSASLDNSRQLQIQCYNNTNLHLPAAILNKQMTLFSSLSKPKKAKNSLQVTRGDSLDEEEFINKRRCISEQIVEIYDNELDITILSSDSNSNSPQNSRVILEQDQLFQFELLIQEKDKDQLFLQENLDAFNSWQLDLLQYFI